MADPFLVAAGPSPARGTAARWRQVALLSAASAINDAPEAPIALASALHALDLPHEARAVAARIEETDPWGRWWRVLSAGASEGVSAIRPLLADGADRDLAGPDASEVARRLADLEAEITALETSVDGDARFALLGVGASATDEGRRALLVGRSSAAYLVRPRWEHVIPVRLAPSDGPSAGNRAHLRLSELVEAICRGESGLGRELPADRPPHLGADDLVSALKQDDSERDRRLLALAQEVQRERAYLADVRAELEAERIALNAERRRRVRPVSPGQHEPGPAPGMPRDRKAAAALLGVPTSASRAQVEQAYRAQIGRAHPDRVEGMHPMIRTHAEGLTVALNAARDLLLGRGSPRGARRERAAG